MEEDIKVLEKLINQKPDYCCYINSTGELNETEKQAIKNLIARYKELEEEDTKIRAKFILQLDDYILKSKVKEILSICRDGDLYGFKQAYETLRDDLQELLED